MVRHDDVFPVAAPAWLARASVCPNVEHEPCPAIITMQGKHDRHGSVVQVHEQSATSRRIQVRVPCGARSHDRIEDLFAMGHCEKVLAKKWVRQDTIASVVIIARPVQSPRATECEG